jgi:transcriptional regulator with XRE-family HTH domain
LDYVAGLVQADLAQEQGGSEYLGKLKRLQAGFALTQRELAELLKVRPQAIRKWFAGGGISPDVRAAIDIHLAQLQRLESHFQPGLLPSILRRPDRGLKGRRPIALVIAGKADEFADYVERVITDDRTA